MKGGKAGRPRKSSSARGGAKRSVRGNGKKQAAKRDAFAPVRQKEKRTTKLGAVRLPDDA